MVSAMSVCVPLHVPDVTDIPCLSKTSTHLDSDRKPPTNYEHINRAVLLPNIFL